MCLGKGNRNPGLLNFYMHSMLGDGKMDLWLHVFNYTVTNVWLQTKDSDPQ